MITGLGYSIKPGAAFGEGVVAPEIMYATQVAEGVYAGFGYPLVVTSGTDSTHISDSYHYSGDAVDLRTNNLPAGVPSQVARSLQSALGSGYKVILEPDHIHVQLAARSGWSYSDSGTTPPATSGDYYPVPGSGEGLPDEPTTGVEPNWLLYGGIVAAAAVAYATLSQ
jgi:hypothetical protein